MLSLAPRLAPRLLRQSVAPLRRTTVVPAAARSFHASARWAGVSTRFTAEHEWVRFDDATKEGVVGITDYAQNSLGDVVFVELPSEGTQVSMGEQIGAVESVKAASDIFSPVSGTIKRVNDKLGDEPGLLNKSPLDDGWLCKIELSDAAEFEKLLDEGAYKQLCEES